MKMSQLWYVAAAVLVASLCAGCTPRVTVETPVAPAEPESFRGLFTYLDGRGELRPCGKTDVTPLSVTPTPALLDAYATETAQGYPGQAIVVAFRGTRDPKTGRVIVRDVEEASAKTPSTTCLPYDVWGLGTEPFWSLQVSAAEGLAEWSVLGEPTRAYAYAAPTVEDGGRVRRYYFRGAQRMKVTVTEEPCRDASAGNRYDYAVTVERAGVTYSGCGTRTAQ